MKRIVQPWAIILRRAIPYRGQARDVVTKEIPCPAERANSCLFTRCRF